MVIIIDLAVSRLGCLPCLTSPGAGQTLQILHETTKTSPRKGTQAKAYLEPQNFKHSWRVGWERAACAPLPTALTRTQRPASYALWGKPLHLRDSRSLIKWGEDSVKKVRSLTMFRREGNSKRNI